MVFPELGINCVLDVGAHHGEFGRHLRRHGYQGFICSFEPVAESLLALKQAADGDSKWRVYPYALSSFDGTAEIRVSEASNYSSFSRPSSYGIKFDHGIVTARTETVAVKRLDSVIEDVTIGIATPSLYLKIDTQGWDLDVLHGAIGSVDAIRAAQSEMSVRALYVDSPHYLDALAEWGQHHFMPSAFFTVAIDRNLRLVEFDCVMVKT